MDRDTLARLLEQRRFRSLRQMLAAMDAVDVARLLDDLPSQDAVTAFRLLPKNLAVDVFDHLDVHQQHRLLESFTASSLLEAMPPDDRAELLEEVPAVVAKRLLQLLSPEQRKVTLELLGYNDGSAGRVMTPFLVDLRADMTVKEALERIRKLALERETIYESYVIDSERHLLGQVSLKNLVLSDPETRVSGIMQLDPHRVRTDTDQEEVVNVLRDYHLLAVPVVDSEDRLVGIITHDDVVDIMEEEATEDIYRFGAVPGTERGYFTSRILSVVRRRVVWLFLLILVNTLTASIIAGQSELLGEVLVLAAFIPLLTGTGGNAGAQSATVVIRGLSTGEITSRRAAGIVTREACIGLLMGVLLAAAVIGWGLLLGRNMTVAFTVSLTMVAIATVATITGATLPFLLRVFRFDPALLSVPLITTIMDVFGLILYFFVAHLLLRA